MFLLTGFYHSDGEEAGIPSISELPQETLRGKLLSQMLLLTGRVLYPKTMLLATLY